MRELVGVVAVAGTPEEKVAALLWMSSRFTVTPAVATSDGVIVRGIEGFGGVADVEAVARVRALLAN